MPDLRDGLDGPGAGGAVPDPGSAATSTELVWINDIYGFVIAGLLLTLGALGVRIGRRGLLLIGLRRSRRRRSWRRSPRRRRCSSPRERCSGSPRHARALDPRADQQHVPGPGRADPGDRDLDRELLGRAAVGPLFGGLLLEWFWWGSVFLLAVPAMALLLVVGPGLLPELRNLAVHDLDRARTFYGDTLGLETSEKYGLMRLRLAGGRDTLVYEQPDATPASFTILTFEVDDIHEAVDALAARGVVFERLDGLEQDGRGAFRQDGPYIAWFKDPSGNVLSALQEK